MKKGQPKKKAPKTENKQTNKKSVRGKNGGARPGAGRKKKIGSKDFRTIQEMCENHALETVEVKIIDRRTRKTTTKKMTRTQALLDVLYNKGITNKDTPAIKEYFDRTMGRARQQVEFSGKIKTEEQRIPGKKELKAVQAYEQALRDA